MSYARTPTLSVEAPQNRWMLFSVISVSGQVGWPGAVGCCVSDGMLTRRRSRLGPPLAVVAVARILLVPAGSVVLMLASAQVSQLVVGLNAMSLATVVPLAYRNVRMTVPATSWLTVNST